MKKHYFTLSVNSNMENTYFDVLEIENPLELSAKIASLTLRSITKGEFKICVKEVEPASFIGKIVILNEEAEEFSVHPNSSFFYSEPICLKVRNFRFLEIGEENEVDKVGDLLLEIVNVNAEDNEESAWLPFNEVLIYSF